MSSHPQQPSWSDRWADAMFSPAVHRRLATVITVALALLCLWLAARLLWLWLAAPPDAPQMTVTELPEPAQPAPSEGQPRLSHWHLFGEFQPAAELDQLRYAPETDLDLALRGIVAGDDPESGYAIIVADGRQRAYGIGQAVSDGVRVRAVYPDRVVLVRDGNPETLRLRETTSAQRAAGAATDAAAETPETPGATGPARWAQPGNRPLPNAWRGSPPAPASAWCRSPTAATGCTWPAIRMR